MALFLLIVNYQELCALNSNVYVKNFILGGPKNNWLLVYRGMLGFAFVVFDPDCEKMC